MQTICKEIQEKSRVVDKYIFLANAKLLHLIHNKRVHSSGNNMENK